MRRPLMVLPVLLMVVTACSEQQPPSQVQPKPSATSATSAPTTKPDFDPGKLSAWTPCEGDFDCATLSVALDRARPSLGTVELAVTRRKASGSRRIGSLVVNPGGPGASAVEFLQGDVNRYPVAIRERFDLVAFDPRGVGRSAPVRCATTTQLDAYFHLDPTPDNARELAAFEAGNKSLAQGCQTRSGRILPFVGTATVAEDMERVRIALGEPKLTYLGYSYGTAIGAAYLDRYPTRVRAMVLDGALDPASTWDQLLAGQAKGFDAALKAFLDHCQQTRCEFREAVSGDLGAAFDKLAARVETHPLSVPGPRSVGPGEFSLGVGAGLYDQNSGWPAIAQGLVEATRGQGSTLLAMSDSYLRRRDNGYENIIEANNAVNCIDRPWPRTRAPYEALARQVAKEAPRFGPSIALAGLTCSVWPLEPTGTPHKVTGAGSPPILVIGTTGDPATPYSWAQSLAGQLDNGVLLTYRGEGHTIYRARGPLCVTGMTNDYLIDLTPPRPKTC